MTNKAPAPLAPNTKVGDYQIVRRLAAGGFGVVYEATDPNGFKVAVKEYLPQSLCERNEGEMQTRVPMDKQALYRMGLMSFFEEGKALAKISHPSVVSVQNFFRDNGTVYMVMDFLEGASLQDFILAARSLKRKKIFRESTIRSLFDDVLHGLRIVHQNKLLHLDIKPANIYVTNDDKPVLIDFGAARVGNQPQSLRPMYTPGFAAPEMYRRNSQFGPWTDIYAIGACIYASMVGYPPYEAIQRQERDRIGLQLARMRGIYTDTLISIVEWCLALDPHARPDSVFALQKEIASDSRTYTRQSLTEKLKNLGGLAEA